MFSAGLLVAFCLFSITTQEKCDNTNTKFMYVPLDEEVRSHLTTTLSAVSFQTRFNTMINFSYDCELEDAANLADMDENAVRQAFPNLSFTMKKFERPYEVGKDAFMKEAAQEMSKELGGKSKFGCMYSELEDDKKYQLICLFA
ncbi:hypothetical protein Y032_0287g1455 [Ancylostoma ceylanicum]|nr:hypothetical protein Y032_0287g1455 [Ancylostoma ceylanicum]